MSRTWGEIRYELSKGHPGIDLELLNGWIKSTYREILDHRNWPPLETSATIVTIAPYETGTVEVTNGSTTVTGTGTTFTSAMTGREFRVTGRNEFYTFTYVSATSGTLDRVYEGDTDDEATYRIFKRTYSLAAGIDVLHRIKSNIHNFDLVKWSKDRLDYEAPARIDYGEPSVFVPSGVDEVELYPIPLYARSLPYEYTVAPTEFSGSNTTASPEDWVADQVIIAGVKRLAYDHEKNYAAADRAEAKFARLLAQLSDKESRRVGSGSIQMERRFTRHRTIRAMR